ncbi:MAG: PEP-CTERM sorting domain-containing protein [Verrucomicrobia bacterium]|nr:PEP-CTERM sorting domain-containing protein [Verrucomicrobiota bacterium]
MIATAKRQYQFAMKATYLAQIKLVLGASVVAWALPLSGQTLFSDNFDTDTSASWSVNVLGVGLSDATFAFDYGAVGIPSAPNSSGTTLGLRLRANQFGGASAVFPSGVSVSPTGQNLTGDYRLQFDLWLNYNGPLNGGGSGSTQITGAGIGTAGASPQIAGQGAIDSIFFGASGDGGSSVDYRAYSPAVTSGYNAASGVFAAGTGTSPDARNNTHPYYAGFGGASAPAAQATLFPQQTGATATGAAGFAWRNVVIDKLGNTVQFSIDGLPIATVDAAAAGTLGGGAILLNQFDINATISSDPNSPDLLFGLVDNVQVSVIPEPSVLALAGLGALVLLAIRRRR